MARELKLFGYTMMAKREERELLGMRAHNQQVHAVVAARTKRQAMAAFGIKPYVARDYMFETGGSLKGPALENEGKLIMAAPFPASIEDKQAPAFIVVEPREVA